MCVVWWDCERILVLCCAREGSRKHVTEEQWTVCGLRFPGGTGGTCTERCIIKLEAITSYRNLSVPDMKIICNLVGQRESIKMYMLAYSHSVHSSTKQGQTLKRILAGLVCDIGQ